MTCREHLPGAVQGSANPYQDLHQENVLGDFNTDHLFSPYVNRKISKVFLYLSMPCIKDLGRGR